MPGELPDTSAYTYAVEYSVDEAVEARATDVEFNKPVVTYVDNFLDFKAGTTVPAAFYDKAKAAWVPSQNGIVLDVVSETGGKAQVDVDGDGTADSGEQAHRPRHRRRGADQARAAVRRRRLAVARAGEALHAVGLQLALRLQGQLPAAGQRPAAAPVLPGVRGGRLDRRRLQPDPGREGEPHRHAVRAPLRHQPRPTATCRRARSTSRSPGARRRAR